ncbi:Gfo/Idh/MocA family oxidoreductase [Tessaracoccus coleopterorum]|uniref:Gfo/Idh/MocA family oxidoreductase n=1 Tax=Tessaracoccus coleopterorum TaxID=2714950 RepID=UPI0018D4CCCD
MRDAQNIRIAILGSSAGNGHPYSWSAIINGYDRDRMTAECPFPGIPDYLNKEPEVGLPGVEVTHIHCVGDGGFTADHVAACARIGSVVTRPEDVIGEVDAVIVATDRGSEHVDRCRPFVEAGIPLFVDKPLATDRASLSTFLDWRRQSAPIMSSSSMRYAKEFAPFRASTNDLGELRLATITSPKSWEAYGIHALEAIYPILGPGFESVTNTGSASRNVVHLTHRRGVDVVATVTSDLYGGFGLLQLAGTHGSVQARFADTFHAFRAQLADFIGYLRTGTEPYPFDETAELMRLVIGGIESRDRGGARIGVGADDF